MGKNHGVAVTVRHEHRQVDRAYSLQHAVIRNSPCTNGVAKNPRGAGARAASSRLATCTVHRPIPARASPITLDGSRSGSHLDRPGSTNVTRGRKCATGECIEIHHTLTVVGESPAWRSGLSGISARF